MPDDSNAPEPQQTLEYSDAEKQVFTAVVASAEKRLGPEVAEALRALIANGTFHDAAAVAEVVAKGVANAD